MQIRDIPPEILCQTFEKITDLRDVTRLRSTNTLFRSLVSECITKLTYPNEVIVTYDIIHPLKLIIYLKF